ncbi:MULTISPECIES: transcription-repair coupling factor [Micrococcaceae]|uniref:transcription-repair coupling factor n=1 Tax=Micrococcaceae TaxID=1268 RepID=UPI001619EE5A|nr:MULTISPECIES: transcription-repair coupling factor [Micrococcaceae]MBB5748110.1 transcription-repair coupling factor (superfamily II helicase) [Micrococcus sp. TA1]HRO30464.1 transcription-repair coupling factor [Citricoccus sp.]HRO92559.1 transcription-repair coupling factor [Citricoccus sp.]
MTTPHPLAGLFPALLQDPSVAAAVVSAGRTGADRTEDLEISLPDGARAPLAAMLAGAHHGMSRVPQDAGRGLARPGVVLLVTATSRESEDLAADLAGWMDPETVAHFPSWETLPHERLSPRSDTVGNRLAVLRRLTHPGEAGRPPLVVVTAPVRSVLQPLVAGLGDLTPVRIRVGEDHDFDAVVQALADAAYSRVDMVSRRGEYAVRGGLLDVFPPTEAHPLRIEFFGDTVEQMRYFSVADQRSLQDATGDGSGHPTTLYAPPCRELLLTDSVRRRARDLQPSLPGAVDMLERIAEGIAVEGMESLAPVLADGMVPFLELLPEDSLTVLVEPEKVRHRADDLLNTNEEFLTAAWASASQGGAAPVDIAALGGAAGSGPDTGQAGAGGFATLAETRATALGRFQGWWQLTALGADVELLPDASALRTAFTEPRGFHGDVDAMIQHVSQRCAEGWQAVVATDGPGPARRLAELLGESGLPAVVVETVPAEPQPGQVTITTAVAGSGFAMQQAKVALLTEQDLFGRNRVSGPRGATKTLARKRRNAVDPLSLTEGDYVVHSQHGIARFVELQRRKVAGAGTAGGAGSSATGESYREYLVLEYAPSKRGAPGDRLFVPTDQLDQVSRYVGGEAPSLSKMGGSDWASTKSKAKKATKQIAGELIRLYSARMASRGHSFAADTPWQRELEESFAFIETPDQLTTINEVKQDMEAAVPMDRLISGDVGFGKTEVAVRAAFKAVQDGKQVAVLVPTTLLARQHHETFTERFAGFPVKVRALSRFQNAAESKETLDGMAEGSVDVVIGTHRLLSKEIRFKDLGLVIVDEEQRFGVEHKEALKTMRTNVDVLAMSATPIPRTLEMSLTGIRETSTLATAPEERHPVLTYVGPYTDQQVTAAVRRELMREGQVFVVHNRVSSIDKVAARIRELVPEARVVVAHGKMGENRLEQVMVDFWERKFDVLVSTTIIETGLDIANANTLIIDRADAYGLSQLHQLRGRVGRGRDRAYAYFLYDAEKPLGETALERLKAVAAHNELGSGMQLAMKDLEIRGAGNLLGGEQSGHIAGVGFDLYLRMVGEAVADFKGGEETAPAEVKVELPINAHLPHDYVPGERLRLEAYRNLAQANDDAAVDAVVEELQDRYGELPGAAQNLVAVARFRNAARAAGVTEVMLMGQNVKFGPADLPESREMRLKRMYKGASVKPALNAVMIPRPRTAPVGGKDLVDLPLLDWAAQVLKAIFLPDQPAA